MVILNVSIINVFAQTVVQVVTEDNAENQIPVIIKHLPDWKNVQSQAKYIGNQNDLRKVLGERPVFNLISFEGGNEAATANYEAGKLLLVEFSTPQFSIDADNQIKQFYEQNPSTPPVYFRRVGNYEVLVFDAVDETAATELIDQVKYEKSVQWLGEDPFLYRKAERAYLKTTGDVFVSTIISIVLGISFAACAGIAIGLFIFYLRKQKRAQMTAFSDAGGMIRLNLDELTSNVTSDRLLKE